MKTCAHDMANLNFAFFCFLALKFVKSVFLYSMFDHTAFLNMITFMLLCLNFDKNSFLNLDSAAMHFLCFFLKLKRG